MNGQSEPVEDTRLVIRYDPLEETHFTFADSPVLDEIVPCGIGGVMGTVHKTTDQIVGQRRGLGLRDLSPRISKHAIANYLERLGKERPFRDELTPNQREILH